MGRNRRGNRKVVVGKTTHNQTKTEFPPATYENAVGGLTEKQVVEKPVAEGPLVVDNETVGAVAKKYNVDVVNLSDSLNAITKKSQLLGKGSYGAIYSLPGSIYPSSNKLCFKMMLSKDLLEAAVKEAEVLLALGKVTGVPRVAAVCQDPPGYIMTQHARTTYFNMLHNMRIPVADADLLEVMRQVTVILQGVHRSGYVHNDVKDDNFSVDLTPSGEVISVTLLDFGVTTKKGEGPEVLKKYQTDDPKVAQGNEQVRQRHNAWMAPEVFHKGQTSPASDTYSVCHCLLTSTFPSLKKCPEFLKQCVQQGLSDDPAARPKLCVVTSCIKKAIKVCSR